MRPPDHRSFTDPLREVGLLLCLVLPGVFSFAPITHAATPVWDGGGGDNNWTTAGNWDVAAVATDTLIFSGVVQTTANNDFADNTPFAGIQFSNTSAGESFTLTGSTVLNLTGDITTAAATGTISNLIDIDLQLTGGTRTINLGTSHDLTISGVISDDGPNRGFIKEGDGTLTLTENNTYGGRTELRGGTTIITNSGALNGVIEMEVGSPVLVLGVDGLDVAEEFFIRNEGAVKTVQLDLVGSNTGTLSDTITINEDAPGNFVLDVGADDTLTVSGQITVTAAGNGGVTKTGAGTLVLSNSTNDYVGPTAVTEGILQISADGVLGDDAAGNGTAVSSGATLSLSGNVDYTGTEELSLAGSGVSGSGALQNLSGDNSFAGPVTLTATSSIVSEAGTLTLSGGVDKAARSLSFEGAGNTTLTSGLNGGGSLTKRETGTLTLEAAGTHSGGTSINAGTTILGNSTALGTSAEINLNTEGTGTTVALGADALNVANNFFVRNGGADSARTIRLDLTGSNTGEFSGQFINNESKAGDFVIDVGEEDTLTMSGNIVVTGGSGASGLTKTGLGTLKLTNSGNNYGGLTTVSSGVLEISANNALGAVGTSSTIVEDGATLALSGGFDYTALEGVSIGGVGHNTEGAINNLSGDNTFAGAVNLASSSTIRSTAGSLDLTGGITRDGSAVLTIDGAGDLTISSNPLSGSGVLRKEGTGTLTLSAANTYTGITDLTGGTTVITNNSSFGTSGRIDVRNDMVLDIGADGLDVSNVFFIRNDAGVKTFRFDLSGTNASELSGDSTINEVSSGAFVVEVGTDDTLTLSGNHASSGAGGGAGITKDGDGTLILSGTNTYLGSTDVDSGTLLIDGSLSTGSAVNVAAGATLGGSGGTISIETVVEGGNATMTTGGTLSAGRTGIADGIGSLTLAGDLSATAATGGGNSATWLVDLNNAITGTSDVIALGDINGRDVSLSNFTLVVNDFGAFDEESGFTYDIATYTDVGGPIGSTFAGLSEGSRLNGLGGGLFEITYGNDLGGGDYTIRLTAVPEPSTVVLLALFLVSTIWITRRRQKTKTATGETC